MNIITISRLRSSGGQTIGREVAHELGYPFVTKQTIETVMKQYGLVKFDQLYETTPGFLSRMEELQEEMTTMLRRIITAIAISGNAVILGRGSFAVFPDFSDVLNVRLWAPLDERVKRYMYDRGITDRSKAKEEVLKSDKVRKTFVERWFHGHPDRSNAFDLVINTAKVSEAEAVRLIVDSARKQKDLVLEGHKTLSSLTEDPVLISTVKDVLAAVPQS